MFASILSSNEIFSFLLLFSAVRLPFNSQPLLYQFSVNGKRYVLFRPSFSSGDVPPPPHLLFLFSSSFLFSRWSSGKLLFARKKRHSRFLLNASTFLLKAHSSWKGLKFEFYVFYVFKPWKVNYLNTMRSIIYAHTSSLKKL